MFEMESRTASQLANCGGDYDQAVQAERGLGLCESVKRTGAVLEKAIDVAMDIGGQMFGPVTSGENERREPRCLRDDVDGLEERAKKLTELLLAIARNL